MQFILLSNNAIWIGCFKPSALPLSYGPSPAYFTIFLR